MVNLLHGSEEGIGLLKTVPRKVEFFFGLWPDSALWSKLRGYVVILISVVFFKHSLNLNKYGQNNIL